MLVLSRKEAESLQIGPNISITVLSVSGGRIRLGISAPPEIPVMRGELIRSDEAPPGGDASKGPFESDVTTDRCTP